MSPMVPTNPLKLDRSHNVRTARRSNAAVCGFLPVVFYLLCSVWFHFSLFFKILFVEILNQNSKEKTQKHAGGHCVSLGSAACGQ